MKILYLAGEAAPFIKTAELGNVAGALPSSLAQEEGSDVRVMIPLYSTIEAKVREGMEFVKSVPVSLPEKALSCGIYKLMRKNVTWYFLENDAYFRRGALYGEIDDDERFAFFSKAALEVLPEIGFRPDLIHANDWQTALTPVYLRLIYAGDEFYKGIKTVFTIHKIKYQGRFPAKSLGSVFGIPEEFYENGLMRFEEGINLMKAGIECADFVTTVSPTYAQEIQSPYHAFGLEAVLLHNRDKLRGIINGIDTEVYNPETDPRLFVNYGPESLEKKEENKAALLKLLGLDAGGDVPLIGLVSHLVARRGLDLVTQILDRLTKENLRLVILGTGEWHYEEMLKSAAARHPDRLSVNIMFSTDLAAKIFAGSDFLFLPSRSEPCGTSPMIAMRYGTVPIVRETGSLGDTVRPYGTGGGNGFLFHDFTADAMMDAVCGALRLYGDKAAFDALRRSCMRADFSYEAEAAEYRKVYRSLLGKR